MGGTKRRAARRGSATVALGLLWLAAGASAAGDVVLAPGTERDAVLAAGERAHYRVDLRRGQATDVLIRQIDATLRVTRADAPDVVRQNDAGRGAVVRLTLTAATSFVVAVKNDATAQFHVRIAPVRAPGDHDRRRADAEQVLADAEERRRALGTLESGNAGAEALASAARERYAQAIERAREADDACGRLMAHAGLARLAFSRGDYAGAQTAAQAALAFRCDDRDEIAADAETAVAERTLGSALGYRGDLVGATAASERALALYRRTGDPNYQAMVLANLSANYRVVGASHRALASAQAAFEIAERIGDRRRALFARQSMAAIRFARGELAPALALYRATIDALPATPYPLIEAMSWNDLGLLYGRLGDPVAADDAFARANAVWRASGDASGLAETGLNEADARYERGDYDAADAGYRRALAFDEEHGFKREASRALHGLGRVAAARGAWHDARTRFVAARDLAATIPAPLLQASSHVSLGDVDSRQGRLSAAHDEYAQALALSRNAADRAGAAVALASLARTAAAQGRLDDARAQIEQALAIVEDQRAAIGEPQLRTGYFASQRTYYALHVDVLMRLHAREPQRGYAAMALAASERARARALRDRFAERRIDLDAAIDPTLLDAEAAAQDRLRRAAWRIAQPGDDAYRAALQAELDAAARDLDRAHGALRTAHPGYASLLHPAPLAPADLQRDLFDARSGALAYWLDDVRSYGWLLTRDGVQAFALPPRATLEADAVALQRRLVEPASAVEPGGIAVASAQAAESEAALRASARRLARQLLPPSLRLRELATLAVIADGELQRVPFAVLDVDARARRDIVYAPSLATLRYLRELPGGAPGRAVAVLADPVFASDDARLAGTLPAPAPDGLVLRAARDLGIGELARLPSTRDEAQAIAALVPAREPWLALDFAANRDAALAADWSRYGVVHFATHALVNARHPELSGVVLSLYGADGRATDGFLRAGDVYRLRMPADLVVLSACNAGTGPQTGAEGAFSLSRAFFYAGARRVVASLWAVDDRASAQFMRHYYRALLHDGEPAERALTTAQAALRRDPRWRAPFFWAGFVLQGDWTPAR